MAKSRRGRLDHPEGRIWRQRRAAAAARREFLEELGTPASGELIPLGSIRQKAGKLVEGFALEGDLDAETIVSNSFACEWPPRSGSFQSFPEVDRAAWYRIDDAREKMIESQWPFLDRLVETLAAQ